ncbi:MAG: epoxyqueuosine reductase QueH [Hydrogenothermaceae bacterium]
MEKILVHICCGVDSVYALRYIKEQMPTAEPVGFFYDPNIHPEDEYNLRWIETKRVCDSLGIECIKGEYELDVWMERVKGYENEPERGERCTICHDLRLERSAELAKQIGAKYLTTVLMMSPKKDFDVLKEIGEKVAKKYGVEFVSFDFRKNGGTEKMNILSRQSQLYHQNYCGCIYGLFGQKKNVEFYPELVSFSKGRLAGSTQELLFIKQIRLFAENLGLNCFEQEFTFIGWRVLSSVLKLNSKEVYHKVLPYSVSVKGVLRDKVKEKIETEDKVICKLYKSTVEIWKVEDIDNFVWDKLRYNTDPVFIVQQDLNPEDKIEIQLKTEFDPTLKSRNLIIGNVDNYKKKFFYSDTDYYGKGGYSITEIFSFIERNVNLITEGDLTVVILGANYCGKVGEKVFYTLSNRDTLSI